MDWPTNDELEDAAVAAVETEWGPNHSCSRRYGDLKGRK